MRRLMLTAALLATLTACSGESKPTIATPTPSTTVSTPPASPVPATPVPGPPDRACYRLSFQEALAPTVEAAAVECSVEHSAMTYAVGTLASVVSGHLLAVDSQLVQAQVAEICPRTLSRFVGGTPENLHLSMLRSVWFTPTVEESDGGADWYRCDVIAVASDKELASLTGRLGGTLATPEGRARFGMCGTDEPGATDFTRVICSADHSWRAIASVEFTGRDYPGEAAARDRGQQPCEDAGREVADDALNFRWGYEWPTEAQWEAGQTFGRCWAPD